MIKKIFAWLIVLTALALSIAFLYQSIPGKPVKLGSIRIKEKYDPNIDYGQTPVFGKNMRFNHTNISYFIGASCSKKRADRMRKAFGIFEVKMKVVSFYEVNNKNADILVGCSDDFIRLEENLFTAGEGGPSRIINTSNFKVIEQGKISLYRVSQCDYPVVELHELGHVFGFDHSRNPRSIMYNISACDQRITDDMVEIIRNLYSIKPFPDLRISQADVVKKGRYLDFNVSVLNEGLTASKNASLVVFADGKRIESFDLGELGVGYGRTLRVVNIRLPSRSVKIIDLIVDPDNLIQDLDRANNKVRVKSED